MSITVVTCPWKLGREHNIVLFSTGYADTGEYWRSWYETDDFEGVLEGLWNEVGGFNETTLLECE